MIKIEITDNGVVDAFNRLIELGENPRGALESIGDRVVDFTKDRFNLSADPYGNPWAPNTDSVLRNALHRSAKNFTNKGALSEDGEAVLAGKKPLIGESGSLSTQFSKSVDDNSVTVTSLMDYAAMQNFGGTIVPKNAKALSFMVGDHRVFAKSVTIPARPFFPNAEQGLPDELSESITEVLRDTLEGAMRG